MTKILVEIGTFALYLAAFALASYLTKDSDTWLRVLVLSGLAVVLVFLIRWHIRRYPDPLALDPRLKRRGNSGES